MPDVNDLDHLDEGLPVNPLPASEVRRRGDRMRRRNTVLASVGGVVAAAVFIGVPVALVSGQDRNDGVEPAPPAQSSGDETAGPWLQSVPAEFPLADGFPETNGDGSPTEVTDRSGIAQEVNPCSPFDWELAFASEVKGISYRGETENRAGRAIAVFEDDQTARDGLAAIDLSLCDIRDDYPYLPSDLEIESRSMELDLGTEDSYAFFERIRAADGSLSDLRVILVARQGNALYVTASLGAAAADQQVDFEANRLKQESARALEAMCLFDAEPCEIASDQSSASASADPSPGPPSEALAEFPLNEGFPESNEDGSPVDVTAVPGVGLINLCDRIAWDPYAGTTDVIGTEYAGPEDYRGRTLGIYKTESAAAAALDNAGRVLEACPEEASDAESGASSVYTRFEVDEGDESLGWTQRYRLPDGSGFDTGLTVYHLVRVGKAVYASYQYGEAGGSEDSIRLAVLAATAAASPIVEEMGGL